MTSSQTTPYSPSLFRLGVYALTSLLLCLTLFLSLFAPMPLIMGVMSSGKKLGYGTIAVSVLGVALLVGLALGEWTFVGLFSYIALIAFLVCESLHRRVSPVKTLVFTGGAVFLSLMLIWQLSGMNSQELWVSTIEKISERIGKGQESVLAQGQNGMEILAILDQSDILAKRIRFEIPGVLFFAIHFSLWLNLLVSLRLGKMLKASFKYTDQDLLNFKVKEGVVWLLIGSISLMLFGESLGGVEYTYIGRSLSLIFAAYYFFQGFGIFHRFLDSKKVFGFFRSFLVVSVIAFAWWLIAVLGIANIWIQFDKYINNKGATS